MNLMTILHVKKKLHRIAWTFAPLRKLKRNFHPYINNIGCMGVCENTKCYLFEIRHYTILQKIIYTTNCILSLK